MPAYPHKRYYTRIPVQRNAIISTPRRVMGPRPLRDLGLGGVYLHGDGALSIGDTCRLEIDLGDGNQIRANGRVVRVESGVGVAISFTEMALESFDELDRFVAAASRPS